LATRDEGDQSKTNLRKAYRAIHTIFPKEGPRTTNAWIQVEREREGTKWGHPSKHTEEDSVYHAKGSACEAFGKRLSRRLKGHSQRAGERESPQLCNKISVVQLRKDTPGQPNKGNGKESNETAKNVLFEKKKRRRKEKSFVSPVRGAMLGVGDSRAVAAGVKKKKGVDKGRNLRENVSARRRENAVASEGKRGSFINIRRSIRGKKGTRAGEKNTRSWISGGGMVAWQTFAERECKDPAAWRGSSLSSGWIARSTARRW